MRRRRRVPAAGRAARRRRRGRRARRSCFPELCDRAGAPAEVARALRRGDRPDRRRPRLGRVPPARDRRRGAARAGGRSRDRRRASPAHARYSVDVELTGHAARPRSCARRFRTRACSSVDASAVPAGCVALLPDDVADLGALRLQVADQTRARARPGALRRRPRRRGRRADAARGGRRRPRARRGRLRGAAGRPRRGRGGRAAARRSCTTSRRSPPATAASFGMRPQPGTNVCHRFRLRHGDVDARLRRGRRGRRGDVPDGRARSTRRWSRTRALAALGRTAGSRSWTGTQTPFNVRERPGARLRPRRGARCASSRRRWAARSARRRSCGIEAIAAALARKAGRPVQARARPRARSASALNRHPAVVRVRLGARARRDARRARRSTAGATPARTPTAGPGVAQKMGFAGVGPYRIPHVRVDSRCVYTNLPPERRLPRLRRDAVGVGVASARSTCSPTRSGSTRSSCACATCCATATCFAPARSMHDVHFAECLRGGGRRGRLARGRPRGKGLCVLLKGMQTPSRAAIRVEPATTGGFTSAARRREMGQGARRAIPLLARRAARRASRSGSRVPDPDTDVVPFDTRTTSSRSTHMMGRALVEAPSRDLRANGDGRGVGEVGRTRAGSTPTPARASRPRTGTRAPRPREVRVDEETGRSSRRALHVAVYAGRVVDRAGRRAAERGLDDHGPRHRAVRGDRRSPTAR